MALKYLKNKFIRSKIKKEVLARSETKDAILWDILGDRTCRIRLLGSDTLLVAKYPSNVETKPAWLKPGNAVKVLHTGGNHRQLEIIGCGQAIPVPMTGSTVPMLPTSSIAENTILTTTEAEGINITTSSLQMYPFETHAMKVWIAVGKYRVSGEEYEKDVMTLDEGNINTLGSGAPFEECAGAVEFAAAHATLYRIDKVVMDTSGNFSVVTGTASSSPVVPSTPTGSFDIGTVLITPGATYIDGAYINRGFSTPTACTIVANVTDSDLAWGENNTTITVKVYDQYGNYLYANTGIAATIYSGTGYIDSGSKYTGSGYQVTFTYTRLTGEGVVESSPIIQFNLTSNSSIATLASIALRDESGEVIL